MSSPSTSLGRRRKQNPSCANCRKKKIKCDLARPSCSSCVRRFDQCSFVGTDVVKSSSDVSTPDSVPPSDRPELSTGSSSVSLPLSPNKSVHSMGSFENGDLQLLHNFLMKTGPSFVADHKYQELHRWQILLPRYGFAESYVMQLMLALSALHLSRGQPSHPGLRSRAEHLYGLALPVVVHELSRLSSENCVPLYLSAELICFYNFALGPQSGEYIAFSDSDAPAWFTLLRGVRLVRERYPNQLQNAFKVDEGGSTPPLRNTQSPLPGRARLLKGRGALDSFLVWLQCITKDEASLVKYITPLQTLRESFDAYIALERGETEFPVVFGWLYRISDDYVAALQSKKPIALVVFGFWCAMLRQQEESRWLLKGWSVNTLKGIMLHLHPDYVKWIQTVREVVED